MIAVGPRAARRHRGSRLPGRRRARPWRRPGGARDDARRGMPRRDAGRVCRAQGGKTHGLQRRIEGPDVAGRRVLAVEDTSATGTSVLTAVDALRDAGAEVTGVAVLVDRGAAPAVAAAGLAYRSVFDLGDLGLASTQG